VKSPFHWLAFIGAFLAGLASYLQTTSMDLSRFGLKEYLAADGTIPAWWHVVAIPFVLGLLYLVTALICLRLRPTRAVAFAVLVVCFLAATALCFFNSGMGLFLSVVLIPLLVGGYPRASASPN
jgi:hypothetical protein